MAEVSRQFGNVNIDPSRRTVVRRLRNLYEASPQEVKEAGAQWYERVHDATREAVRQTPGRTMRHGAGVVAAVSPNMDWERNNIGAFAEISNMRSDQWEAIRHSSTQGRRTAEAKDALKGLSVSTATDGALLKAHRIWIGGEDFEHVLNRRTAPKTNSFAHNILSPHEAGHVTVDGRHADIVTDTMRPWTMGRGIGSANLIRGGRTRYEDYADHTTAAAQQISRAHGTTLLPHQLQAVVWEHGKMLERGYDPARTKGDIRTGQSYQRRLQEFSQGSA